jgi:hypothetical protein
MASPTRISLGPAIQHSDDHPQLLGCFGDLVHTGSLPDNQVDHVAPVIQLVDRHGYFGAKALRHRRGASDAGSDSPTRWSRARRAARSATIAAALLGLNIGAAAWRPLPDPSEHQPSPDDFLYDATYPDEE